jgi:hypothetical protein
MPATSPFDQTSTSGVIGTGSVIGLTLGYLLGWIHAIWVRARADYLGARKAVGGLRTAKWRAWRRLVLSGSLVVVVVFVLLAP